MKRLWVILFVILIFSCEDKKDTTPPEVTITSPTNGSKVNEVVAVSCISTDNKGVEKVELWIDGVNTGLTDDTEPYSFIWNTTTYKDGDHTLIVRGYDTNGNEGDSPPITVKVDNTISVPNSVSVQSADFSNGGFTIKWSKATDGDFKSYTLEHSIESQMNDYEEIFTTEEVNVTSTRMENTSPFTYHYFRVTVTDTFDYQTKGSIYSTSSLDPINLLSQNNLYKKHIRVRWNKPDYGVNFTVTVAHDIDFLDNKKTVIVQDTIAIFKGLDDSGVQSDDGSGYKYYVKVSTSIEGSESEHEIYQTSNKVPLIYIPHDVDNIGLGIMKANQDSQLDTIYVPEGKHNIPKTDIKYPLTIIGMGNPKTVILQGYPLYGSRLKPMIELRSLTMAQDGSAILTDGQIQATNVIFHDFDDIVISHSSNSSSKFTNCIFYNNSFQVFSIYENLTIENCVFFGNNDVIVLNPKGNPHRPMNDSSFVLNSIFFNNTGEIVKHDNFPSEKPKIVSFKYSDIVPEYEGLNNISSDPLFINGTGENFKLDNNSPCINTGHPDSQYNDADGTRNDMGAYGGKYGEWNN